MRTVVVALVGVGLIVAAFGLGRVTRADAGAPVVAPRATPEPLAPGAPVSAAGVEAARAIPALRPKPKPKRKKKPAAPATTRTSAPPSRTTAPPAATAAPSAPRPSTPAPAPTRKKPSPRPVEEIG